MLGTEHAHDMVTSRIGQGRLLRARKAEHKFSRGQGRRRCLNQEMTDTKTRRGQLPSSFLECWEIRLKRLAGLGCIL